MVEMVPACAACKAFVSKLNGAAWESGFGVCAWSVWLASVMSGTKTKHLSEVIQLCQPDVCQVTQFAGAARHPAMELLAPSNTVFPAGCVSVGSDSGRCAGSPSLDHLPKLFKQSWLAVCFPRFLGRAGVSPPFPWAQPQVAGTFIGPSFRGEAEARLYSGRQDCRVGLEGTRFPSVPYALGPAG